MGISPRLAVASALLAVAATVGGVVVPPSLPSGPVATAFAEPAPQPAGAVVAPDGGTPAWLLADLDTGKLLASRDPDARHAPASTIKVLLAMVVLDRLHPDSWARAAARHDDVTCSCVGLTPGRPYTVRALLHALLLVSGNDAADLLGDMLGGPRAATAAMTAKAAALGARSTKASSPSGLDGPGWESVTTPRDLATMFRAALAYPMIAQILVTPSAPFADRTITNQNELLRRVPGSLGGKTGFTNLARKTYVGAAQRGGRRVVVVQMYGTGDLYGPAAALLEWGLARSS